MRPVSNTSFTHTKVRCVGAQIYTSFGRNTSFFDFCLNYTVILRDKSSRKEAVNNLSDFKLPHLIFIPILPPPHWFPARTTGIPAV